MNPTKSNRTSSLSIERFIEEIKKRPELWDTKCTGYGDKNRKTDAWDELYDIFIKGWEEMSPDERFVQGLQQEQTVENIVESSPTFSLEGSTEVQCELGDEVLRKYWQPVESQFGECIEEYMKNFTSKNTDSTFTDVSDSSGENYSDTEDDDQGTLCDEKTMTDSFW